MISFTVKDPSKVRHYLCDYKMIMFAESLGGVQTLITYPLTQTHASIPKEVRDSIGITDRLLRLSVGIEDKEDIIRDLASVLEA
jgi:cystathionine gamma-synthase